MAKSGGKRLPTELHIVRGTVQPCREGERKVPELEGDLVKPKWLTGLAAKLWKVKVARYVRRKQNLAGCEDALAQYCAIEADLIGLRKAKQPVTIAMINAHRIYANEFFDTPASQWGKVEKPGGKGDFEGHGRR